MDLRDDLNRVVPLRGTPERIVSLCPSQTELLFDLGVGDRVVGVTKFCVHPQEARGKTRVGGTKKVHYDRIRALEPDFVLAQREENTRDIVEALEREFPVYVTDVLDVPGALRMIERVAAAVGARDAGLEIARSIRDGLEKITSPMRRPRVLYLIWRGPWMAAGTGTFIDSVLEVSGFTNALPEPRYPTLSEEALRSLDVDAVFLSSEPFPFRDKHIAEVQSLLPNAVVKGVDGEVFSWYGSRMRKIPETAEQLRRFFGEDAFRA